MITSYSRNVAEVREELCDWLDACEAQAKRLSGSQRTQRAQRFQEARAAAFHEAADFWRAIAFAQEPVDSGIVPTGAYGMARLKVTIDRGDGSEALELFWINRSERGDSDLKLAGDIRDSLEQSFTVEPECV